MNSEKNTYRFKPLVKALSATISRTMNIDTATLPPKIMPLKKIFPDFNSVLEPFYANSISHGLALHPAAYFVGNFGSFWILSAVIYTSVLSVLSFLFVRTLGFLYVVIFIVNSVHFFRHGPDVFAKNIIAQSLFFCGIILVAKALSLIAKNHATALKS